MEGSLSLEINFNDKISTDSVAVSESTVFGFFTYRTFSSRSHYPFSIKKITGPTLFYKKDNLDLNDNVSVTFVYPNNDENPFVLIFKKSNGKKLYYKVVSFMFIRWTEVDELNGVPEDIQDKLLLDTYKKIFSQYFDSTLRISESILESKVYTYFDNKYDIVPQVYYCGGYDRYHYSSDKSHSVSTIYINGDLNKINGDIKYVRDFYFYYVYQDTTTPLLIETYDYSFDDSIPLYNYYARDSITSEEWSSVECGSNLVDPKCKGDIKRMLDVVTYNYTLKRVLLEINNLRVQITSPITRTFGGVPFSYEFRTDDFYGCYSYHPIVSKYFLLDSITLNNVKQSIDVHSLHISVVYVFHTNDDPYIPVLLCLGLFNHVTNSTSNYYWYTPQKGNSHVWNKIEFFSSPDKHFREIEEKIKEISNPGFKLSYLYGPLKKLGVFAIGCGLGILVGTKFSRRIIVNTARIYHRLRGYQIARD